MSTMSRQLLTQRISIQKKRSIHRMFTEFRLSRKKIHRETPKNCPITLFLILGVFSLWTRNIVVIFLCLLSTPFVYFDGERSNEVKDSFDSAFFGGQWSWRRFIPKKRTKAWIIYTVVVAWSLLCTLIISCNVQLCVGMQYIWLRNCLVSRVILFRTLKNISAILI